jgi:glycolate oxidase
VKQRTLLPGELLALAAIVGRKHVFLERDDVAPYAHDWTEDLVHTPSAVVRPRTTAEVSAILRLCDERRIPVTPQAGRTGLSGGALPLAGGLVLTVERMNSILEIDTSNSVAVVEPGVVTQTLQEAVEEKGLYYPPDPASRGSCQIGGNIAENAGGPHAAKYGVTGRWVMGLEVVFADGSVAVTGGKTRKDVAGYDLTALLVGSEGTLGVVTKAWLRLIPKPAVWATLVAPFPSLTGAARCVLELHRAGLILSACEMVDRPTMEVVSKRKGAGVPFPEAEARLLIELDGTGEAEVERDVTRAGEIALECGALDVVLATDEPKRRALWDMRRGIAEAICELGTTAELDVAVPRSELVPLVTAVRRIADSAGLRAFAYGHVADGNLHVRLLREGPRTVGPEGDRTRSAAQARDLFGRTASAIYEEAAALGGTVTGEHGVGIKGDLLRLCRPPAFLSAMRAVKHALDPNGILNPGKVLPEAD